MMSAQLLLVFAGLCVSLAALLRKPAGAAITGNPASAAGFRGGLRTGLLSCVLNPKVGLFFLAVVPQFLPAGPGFAATMALGTIDAAVAFAYLAMLAVLAGRALHWLRKPGVNRFLKRLTAAILAALGIGVVASAR